MVLLRGHKRKSNVCLPNKGRIKKQVPGRLNADTVNPQKDRSQPWRDGRPIRPSNRWGKFISSGGLGPDERVGRCVSRFQAVI